MQLVSNNYDINARKHLGKLRKTSTALLAFIVILLIVFFGIISRFADKLTLTANNADIFRSVCYIAIFMLIMMLFSLLVVLTRPSYILQNDLKNIYIVKKPNRVIEISIAEIKKVKARKKNRKKSKREYGTLFITTKKRQRYKINNLYNVTKVEEDVIVLIEKLEIYYEGMRQGAQEYQEAIYNSKKK